MESNRAKYMQAAIRAVKENDFKNIFFTGCGGSMAIMLPMQHMVATRTELTAYAYNAKELLLRTPPALGAGSLLISCSQSGETPETVEVTQYAQKSGATIISLTYKEDSSLFRLAHYPVLYDWGFTEETHAADTNYGVLLQVVASLIEAVNGDQTMALLLQSIGSLQRICVDARKAYQERARNFARINKRSPLIYTMASGLNYGPVYAMSACLLMEMLWIHSNPIHAGEYFHGPFEVTDDDVPFFIAKGIDAFRPVDERAEAFARKYASCVEVVDVADFEWKDTPESIRPYLGFIVLNSVIREYANALADFRGHPLSVRRYMWREDY